MKTIIITFIDQAGTIYHAAALDQDPREALRLAWCQLIKNIEHPTLTSPGQQRPHVDSNGEIVCPDHGLARESKWGGLFCPAVNDDDEFCTWTHGKPKPAKKGK